MFVSRSHSPLGTLELWQERKGGKKNRSGRRVVATKPARAYVLARDVTLLGGTLLSTRLEHVVFSSVRGWGIGKALVSLLPSTRVRGVNSGIVCVAPGVENGTLSELVLVLLRRSWLFSTSLPLLRTEPQLANVVQDKLVVIV